MSETKATVVYFWNDVELDADKQSAANIERFAQYESINVPVPKGGVLKKAKYTFDEAMQMQWRMGRKK